MKLQRSSGKQKRPKLLIRQVAGASMAPTLTAGQIVIASGRFRRLRVYDVVIVRHDGKEKIKRITNIVDEQLYLEGDNPGESTDSRHFGWLPMSSVLAKVYWPR